MIASASIDELLETSGETLNVVLVDLGDGDVGVDPRGYLVEDLVCLIKRRSRERNEDAALCRNETKAARLRDETCGSELSLRRAPTLRTEPLCFESQELLAITEHLPPPP